MKKIEPVKQGSNKDAVHNLQKGLLYLIIHQARISDNERGILTRRIAPEMATKTFGEATADIVGLWQYRFKNWPNYMPALPPKLKAKVQSLPIRRHRGTGEVDEVTAEALNWLLKELGAL